MTAWKLTRKCPLCSFTSLRFHISAVSPFLTHLCIREVVSTVLGGCGEGKMETKTLTRLPDVSPLHTISMPSRSRAGKQDLLFLLLFWLSGFLTCLSFQGSSAGHKVFFPSVGVVWLAWSYSSSNKGYF